MHVESVCLLSSCAGSSKCQRVKYSCPLGPRRPPHVHLGGPLLGTLVLYVIESPRREPLQEVRLVSLILLIRKPRFEEMEQCAWDSRVRSRGWIWMKPVWVLCLFSEALRSGHLIKKSIRGDFSVSGWADREQGYQQSLWRQKGSQREELVSGERWGVQFGICCGSGAGGQPCELYGRELERGLLGLCESAGLWCRSTEAEDGYRGSRGSWEQEVKDGIWVVPSLKGFLEGKT